MSAPRAVGLDLLAPRFWSKVDKAGTLPDRRPDLGPCWNWKAALDLNGYGRFSVGGRAGGMRNAHTVSFWLQRGHDVPDGLELDHLCRNRACVNPTHLEPVTHAENSRRSDAGSINRERQLAITACPHGHAYDEANTSYRPDGRRRCKACVRAYKSQRREVAK